MRARLSLGPREAEVVREAIASWFVMREGEEWTARERQTADRLEKVDTAIIRALTPEATAPGTLTNCPLAGVHEHVFRGPHRFREWEPGT
jgi:hypothetical protein